MPPPLFGSHLLLKQGSHRSRDYSLAGLAGLQDPEVLLLLVPSCWDSGLFFFTWVVRTGSMVVMFTQHLS